MMWRVGITEILTLRHFVLVARKSRCQTAKNLNFYREVLSGRQCCLKKRPASGRRWETRVDLAPAASGEIVSPSVPGLHRCPRSCLWHSIESAAYTSSFTLYVSFGAPASCATWWVMMVGAAVGGGMVNASSFWENGLQRYWLNFFGSLYGKVRENSTLADISQ